MIFLTKLKAVDPKTGKLELWGGPRVEADSWGEAEQKIKDRGYLEMDGWLVQELEFRLSKQPIKQVKIELIK